MKVARAPRTTSPPRTWRCRPPRAPAPDHPAQPFPGYAGSTVVFSTYQSIDVLRQAQQMGFPDFDLIVCDEAHRTAGATLAGRRLPHSCACTTIAHPRHQAPLHDGHAARVRRGARKKAENSVVVASMDDAALLVPVPPPAFGEAVEGGLLSDYKVLVLAVDEAAITRQFQELLTDKDGQLSIDDVPAWSAAGRACPRARFRPGGRDTTPFAPGTRLHAACGGLRRQHPASRSGWLTPWSGSGGCHQERPAVCCCAPGGRRRRRGRRGSKLPVAGGEARAGASAASSPTRGACPRVWTCPAWTR
ncbi:hypothetical protein QJS66_10415 [Kocuria rhizophila]|nr:hypothetical protein QJS66_10415 [Kocuria rhizophila]